MEHFSLYLLKVSASIAAFYSLYYLLFRKEKQFAFNRVYLSSILIISFLIPLITLKTEVSIVQSLNSLPANSISKSNLNYLQLANQNIEISTFDLWTIIKTAYLFACCFLFFRLLLGVFKVKQIIWKGEIHEISGQEVITTKKEIYPLSSFNKIVIPENLLNSKDLAMIIMHEKVHIKEKHFIDLLLSEIFLLVLWFNPFSWFVNSAIRTNLEFSADDAVKNELYDLEEYQMAMVRLIDSKHISPFANALNVSQLKNRIMMMKRKKQNRYAVLKKLAVLPMLCGMLLLLSAKEKVVISAQDSQLINIKGKVTETGANKPIPGVAVVVKGTTIGAITDKEGNYTINFPDANNVLVFALVGYKLKEVEINDKELIDVSMDKEESPGIIINKLPDMTELGKIVIKGKVTESDSEKALGGVSIIIKGKPTGTMTDINGNYQIHVSKEDNKLVFISPDYQTQEIDIDEIKEINVKLLKK